MTRFHRPLRVLSVVVIPPHLRESGAVSAALGLSAALRTDGVAVSVARMSDRDGHERHDELDVRLVRARLPFDGPLRTVWRRVPNRVRTPLYASSLSRLVSGAGYDLVHLHNPIPTLELARVASACRAAGVPYVFSTHGLVEVTSGGRAYRLGPSSRLAWSALVARPLRYVLDHAAAVLALSEADRPILESFGCHVDRTWIVPNGVRPPAGPGPDGEALERAARRYGISPADGAPTCFFLGNHTPNKGVQLLLDAVTRTEAPIRLIVGGARRDHVDYGRYAAMRAPGRSIVFTGRVEDEDLPALFAMSDLFVFPTLADTFPLVVLEAMAHGVPVLSTTVGGIPHQVDADTGRLVPPGDVGALARAWREMTADREALRRMGARAAAVAAARFGWEASARTAHEAYRTVVARA